MICIFIIRSQSTDAYLSGDPSGLSELDKKIYDKAVEIIENIINEDMSLYEKELAIHDYIVLNTKYDAANLRDFFMSIAGIRIILMEF